MVKRAKVPKDFQELFDEIALVENSDAVWRELEGLPRKGNKYVQIYADYLRKRPELINKIVEQQIRWRIGREKNNSIIEGFSLFAEVREILTDFMKTYGEVYKAFYESAWSGFSVPEEDRRMLGIMVIEIRERLARLTRWFANYNWYRASKVKSE